MTASSLPLLQHLIERAEALLARIEAALERDGDAPETG